MNNIHSFVVIGFFAVIVIQVSVATKSSENLFFQQNSTDGIISDSEFEDINLFDNESKTGIAGSQGDDGLTDSNTVDTDDSFQQFIEAEHQKYTEITVENINKVINLGKKTEKFPQKIDRKEIVYFFHAADFNVDKAVNSIVKHYENRIKLKEIFNEDGKDPDLAVLKETKEVISYSILFYDGYESGGTHYVYVRFKKEDTSKYDFVNIVRYFFYVIKCLLKEYGTFDGIVMVVDVKDFNVALAVKLYLSKSMFGFLSNIMHGALPLRLKNIYVVNENYTILLIYKTVKKFRNRQVPVKPGHISLVKFSTDKKTVFKVPKNIMPNDGFEGGEGPSLIDQEEKTFALLEKHLIQYKPNPDD